MKLVIGGYAQGKLNYALQAYASEEVFILDGEVDCQAATQGKKVIINHFHKWVKKCLEEDRCPEVEIITFLEKYPDSILISDEIGNGIVPVDAFEREYRERTGRLLVTLAGQAEEVVRVICGIGQKIK